MKHFIIALLLLTVVPAWAEVVVVKWVWLNDTTYAEEIAGVVGDQDVHEIWLYENRKLIGVAPFPHQAGQAVKGQTADVATTAIGVGALGLVEANPLGLGVLPAKAGMYYWSKNTDWDTCSSLQKWMGNLGWGAAAANIVTMLGAPVVGAIAMFAGAAAIADANEDSKYVCAAYKLREQS